MMLFLMRTPMAMTITAIRTTATWKKIVDQEWKENFYKDKKETKIRNCIEVPTRMPTIVPKSDFWVGAAVAVGGGAVG